MKRHYLILSLILFLTFIFRFPSLFEPFWYGDEGIFAAVGRNLNHGGVLYQTAWDNKPPMIYLTYATIFKFFGVSMFSLRMVTIVVVLATATVIYEIGVATIGVKRALFAAFIFGLLTCLRLIEGNLALTEIFMILPISLAMMITIKRKFDHLSLFAGGFLIALASLYKQVGAFEAAALGIFIFLWEKDFLTFVKKGFLLSVGFAIPYLVTTLYFAPKHLISDYIFAAYTYYRIYLGESPKYAILINIAKYLPVLTAIFYGLWKKFKLKNVEVFYLFFLWAAFSFLGSYFSGRTYGHYLVQATPAISLLIASLSRPVRFDKARVIFALGFFVPLIFLTRLLFSNFLSGGPVNQIKYWGNFLDFAQGNKSINAYNDYFDSNVNTIMALADFMRVNKANSQSVYIWGDYPWLYAIADLKNPTRYVTSFHVFVVPDGQSKVSKILVENPPVFIIKPKNSIGYFAELEKLLSANYTLEVKIETAEVYSLKRSR